MQEYRDDWKLMFSNAKQFNGEDSWVVQDGKAIEKELDRVLKKNGFSDEKPKTPQKPKEQEKKKLRIKLSLKSIKAAEGADENIRGDVENGDEDSKPPAKKRRKKNQVD
jgi:hypothetical protein